jgi:hypothetical protein
MSEADNFPSEPFLEEILGCRAEQPNSEIFNMLQ